MSMHPTSTSDPLRMHDLSLTASMQVNTGRNTTAYMQGRPWTSTPLRLMVQDASRSADLFRLVDLHLREVKISR